MFWYLSGKKEVYILEDLSSSCCAFFSFSLMQYLVSPYEYNLTSSQPPPI
jgi:hypothetical protein